MNFAPHHAYYVADVASLVAIGGAFAGFFPHVAAIAAFLWYCVQLFDSKPVQRFLRKRRRRLYHKRRQHVHAARRHTKVD